MFDEHLAHIADTIANVNSVSLNRHVKTEGGEPAGATLTVRTTFSPPYDSVSLRMSQSYLDNYPVGEVSFLVAEHFQIVPVSAAMTLHTLVSRVLQVCQSLFESSPSMTMEGSHREGSSWSMEPTCDIQTPPTGLGAQFQVGLSAALTEDVEKASKLSIVLQDHPSLNIATVVLSLPIDCISDVVADSWEVVRTEPLQIILSFNRQEYLESAVKVEVGQRRNFLNRCFFGLPGQMQLVLQRFCDSFLPANESVYRFVSKGYHRDSVNDAGPLKGDVDDQVVRAMRSYPATGRREPGKFFLAVEEYARHRLKTLAKFCVLCDRAHTTGGLSRLSICGNQVCCFQFEQLDVGKSFNITKALQTGVVDLLVNLAKAAARSQRWAAIFTPYPLIKEGGELVISPERKEACHSRVVEIFNAMPPTYQFLHATALPNRLRLAHPMATSMFQWVMNSAGSHLVKLEDKQRISFMRTTHQFLFSMASDERIEKFNQLKAKHGSCWAFHGSRAENWHSILRNGLKNASGTALMVNGAAYGNGIYLSPHSSVSFGYSNVTYGSNAAVSEEEAKFIDVESMFCIAINEVANIDINKSGNIWVQPHEEAVMTRFLFVYSRNAQADNNVDLEQPAPQKELAKVVSEIVFSKQK